MRRLLVAVVTVVTPAAPLLPCTAALAMITAGAAAGIWLTARAAQPVAMVAVCYGVGCRGPGYDHAISALHPACRDTLRYGGSVCPVLADVEPAVLDWCCDDPDGDFSWVSSPSSMSSWSAGQRTPAATH